MKYKANADPDEYEINKGKRNKLNSKIREVKRV